MNLNQADTEQLQHFLKVNGFNPGRIDGRMGPMTEKAFVAFIRSTRAPAIEMPTPSGRTELNLEIKATKAGREAMAIRLESDGARRGAELIREGISDKTLQVECAIAGARQALKDYGK